MPPELEIVYAEMSKHWPSTNSVDTSEYLIALRMKENWFWKLLIVYWWDWARERVIAYENHMSEFPKSHFFPLEWEGQLADELDTDLNFAWTLRPLLNYKGKKV